MTEPTDLPEPTALPEPTDQGSPVDDPSVEDAQARAALAAALPDDVRTLEPDPDALARVAAAGGRRRRAKVGGLAVAVALLIGVPAFAASRSGRGPSAQDVAAGPGGSTGGSARASTSSGPPTTFATTAEGGGSLVTTTSVDLTSTTGGELPTTSLAPTTTVPRTTTSISSATTIPATTSTSYSLPTNTTGPLHTIPQTECGEITETLNVVTTGTILVTMANRCILDAFAAGTPANLRLHTYNPPEGAPESARADYPVAVILQIDGVGAVLVQEESHPGTPASALVFKRCTQLGSGFGTTWPIGYASCTITG